MGRGTSFYWRYEKFIRLHESRAGSTVGATGAIYAIRRALFEPIPNDTILDDVLIPLRIVRRGYSVQFEPEARAFQAVSATAHQEFVRKLRTIAGTFQLFARERWLLNPLQNPLWFETVSHKGLRLVLPVLHAALFAASVALADGVLYRCGAGGTAGLLCRRACRSRVPTCAAAADPGHRSLCHVPHALGDRRGICPFHHPPSAGDVGTKHRNRDPDVVVPRAMTRGSYRCTRQLARNHHGRQRRVEIEERGVDQQGICGCRLAGVEHRSVLRVLHRSSVNSHLQHISRRKRHLRLVESCLSHLRRPTLQP